MRVIRIIALMALAGCTSTGAGSPGDTGSRGASGQPPTRTLGEQYVEGRITNVQPNVDRVSHDIPAMANETWEALIAVYETLGIEAVRKDVGALTLGNPSFSVSRRLAGERLSRFFRCGTGVTGAFADRYRLNVNIVSRVISNSPEDSVLETTIQASGTNPAGTSNTRVPCGSTHFLESRIAAEVAAMIKGSLETRP